MTTVGSYAMVAQLHMERYGTKPEQLAEVAVTMRRHASLKQSLTSWYSQPKGLKPGFPQTSAQRLWARM